MGGEGGGCGRAGRPVREPDPSADMTLPHAASTHTAAATPLMLRCRMARGAGLQLTADQMESLTDGGAHSRGLVWWVLMRWLCSASKVSEDGRWLSSGCTVVSANAAHGSCKHGRDCSASGHPDRASKRLHMTLMRRT